MKRVGLVVVGFVLGVLVTSAAFIFEASRHESYVATTPLTLALGEHGENRVTLPRGTVLYHDAFFSEGFDQLVLYVNTQDRRRFTIIRTSVTRPYWIVE